MLTLQQVQIAEIVGASIGDLDFALAGGAALISKELVDRGTRDLDFFGPSEDALGVLVSRAEKNLAAEGMGIEYVQRTPAFVRIAVTGPEGEAEVDFASMPACFLWIRDGWVRQLGEMASTQQRVPSHL